MRFKHAKFGLIGIGGLVVFLFFFGSYKACSSYNKHAAARQVVQAEQERQAQIAVRDLAAKVQEKRDLEAANIENAISTIVKPAVQKYLNNNSDRAGKMKMKAPIDEAHMRIYLIRFPEPDGTKWAGNSTGWNQVRLDTDNDGSDDEKWLIKYNMLYKREFMKPGKPHQYF